MTFSRPRAPGLRAAGLMLAPGQGAAAQASRGERPARAHCFELLPDPMDLQDPSDGGGRGGAAAAPQPGALAGERRRLRREEMKKKYGEITMLDFPQFTKDTFPGVTHMDIFSGLFGDVTDDTHVRRTDVRSVDALGQEVARQAGREAGADRDQGAAHLEQRAERPRRSRRNAPQGRCRGRQEVARWRARFLAPSRCG